MLYDRDFQDYDGNLSNILAEISEWIIENNPRNPTICVISQTNTYIHIRLFYED